MILNQTITKRTTVKFQQLIDRSITEVLADELDKITSISAHAFQDCKLLEVIHIPANIETIDTQAFNGCTSLADIHIDKPADSIEGAPWGAPDTATVHWKDEVIE